MKKIIGYSISFMILGVMIGILSCSKKTEEVIPPIYLGKWEINLAQSTATNTLPIKQTLEITKDRFTDKFYQNNNNNSAPYIVATGSFSVIENIEHISILKLGKSINQNPMVYYTPTDIEFTNILLNELKIMQNTMGTWDAGDNQLTLRLDFNGDGISGDQGVLVYDKVK